MNRQIDDRQIHRQINVIARKRGKRERQRETKKKKDSREQNKVRKKPDWPGLAETTAASAVRLMVILIASWGH